jgi:aquaporin Z
MKKLLTEFIGTFFLVFTIGLVVTQSVAMAPVAIGSILMVMVYAGGHVSGAHYNPAVSLAVLVRGKSNLQEFIAYVATQISAAFIAACVVYIVTGKTFVPTPNSSVLPALIVETLFTFALALTVLNTATSKSTSGNSFYGLAIGFTVLAAAFAGGPISGGAFNPAVGIGPALCELFMGTGSISHIWIYLVGPLVGGMIAGIVFNIQEN